MANQTGGYIDRQLQGLPVDQAERVEGLRGLAREILDIRNDLCALDISWAEPHTPQGAEGVSDPRERAIDTVEAMAKYVGALAIAASRPPMRGDEK